MAKVLNMKGQVVQDGEQPEVENVAQEEAPVANVESKEQINLMEYTYDKGQKVEIDGELILVLLETLQEVWQSETKIEFDLKESFQETVKGGAKRKTTDLGIKVWALADTMAQYHINNINAGKATKVDANK